MTDQWIVHPNRSALGPDEPGHNGHYRTLDTAATSTGARGLCVARVLLPPDLHRATDNDGSVTFTGSTWRFVVAAARSFAEDFTDGPVLPPFGINDRGQWWWWDNTTTDYSILETLDAAEHVRRYLQGLFPNAAAIDLADHR
ncbi:hypothetical protein [Mycolicibacterium sp.]|uniref:hypothetical protein n=1 Tax=Mycolicibacterium sp. TaxID=2320850 RepID=UPI003560B201